MYPAISVVTIISLILIFATYEYQKYSMYDHMLNGYWEASATFCNKSEIKSAQAFFNDDNVYFIIEGYNGVLLNKCLEFTRSPDVATNVFKSDNIEYAMEFDDDVDPLPRECRMVMSLTNGLLGFYVDETLYMELYKNNKLTVGTL
jgi:hypothetical protein